MLLGCQKTWIDPETGSRYEAGNKYDIADRKAEQVYLRAPEGAFTVFGQDAPQRPAQAATKAISETTASDITVPDRKARGGKKRTGSKRPRA